MDIELSDGFKIIREKDGIILLVESDKIEACMKYALEKNITRISIHAYHGYKLSDVNFLREYPFITHLSVIKDLNDIDISAVHYLHKLKYLTLSNDKQSVDFSSFPVLEEASIDWNNKLINLPQCTKIKRLTLWKYKPKSKSLAELQQLHTLESLEITQSNIESLVGIENLKKLHNLEAYYLSKLASLNGLEKLAKSLKVLILKNCKHLNQYEHILEKMSDLEKMILSDCGELSNLNFIKKMESLRFISFVNTNVKDGNLQPLKEKNLEYAGFDDKKHYSIKMKEITDFLLKP